MKGKAGWGGVCPAPGKFGCKGGGGPGKGKGGGGPGKGGGDWGPGPGKGKGGGGKQCKDPDWDQFWVQEIHIGSWWYVVLKIIEQFGNFMGRISSSAPEPVQQQLAVAFESSFQEGLSWPAGGGSSL